MWSVESYRETESNLDIGRYEKKYSGAKFRK